MHFPISLRLLVGLGVGTLLAYAVTPLAIRAARRFAFFDLPAGYKGHARPTPYLGGTAVMAAFGLGAVLAANHPGHTWALLGGVLVLLVLGTVDDRVNVSPGLRVLVEVGLGVLLSLSGLGWHLGSGGALDATVTAVWVVGVVNAFNLFDNMDGAASTMAAVVSAGACTLALFTGDVWVAAGSAALCGACLGFLPHNLSSPARIFLGDGGSMPLGFAVAILVAGAARSAEASALSLLVGALLVGIPALDTSLVLISRRRRGISVLTGGRDHLTHRFRQWLGTPRRVALVLGGTQLLLSALVILASREGSSLVVYIVLAFVVCAIAAIIALEDATALDRPAERAAEHAPEHAPAVASRREPPPRNLPRELTLAGLGLAAGLSPFFSAYYNLGVWLTIGLVLVVAAAMAMIVRPPRLTWPVGLVIGGLAGLGIWSLISMSWAGAVEQASTSANLWLTYVAFVVLLVTLVRRPRDGLILLAGAGAGIAIVGVSVLIRLLGSDPASLFIGGRLNSPLGYINGEGCVFAMGAWPCLALAERRQPLVAGLGAASAVVMACLALLSQSRGAAIATFVTVIVVLCLVPGFRRRVLALAFVAVGVGIAASHVTSVYTAAVAGQLTLTVTHHAVIFVLLGAVIAGVVWGLVVAGASSFERRGDARVLGRIATVAAVLVLAVPVVGALVRASSLEHTVRTQWHAFTHLSDPSGTTAQTRLFSGAGNRYDYWRVAWHVFEANPLAGVGAGNYAQSYFLERHTQEAVQNPHSIELQTLSELGIVGVLLLALFVIGAVLAALRARAAALSSPAARALMVAAVGTGAVWFLDTSGDWMHLLPGVTAIALCAVVALCRTGSAPAGRPRRFAMLGAAAAAVFVLAVAGASLLRADLAEHYLDNAQNEIAAHPAAAISDAQQVLRLDSSNLTAYYLKAAGQARFDRAGAARATLLQAARQDPQDYVTWTLLGDLETRAGHLAAARAYYRRALALDPHEPGLAAAVRDPSLGLPRAGPG